MSDPEENRPVPAVPGETVPGETVPGETGSGETGSGETLPGETGSDAADPDEPDTDPDEPDTDPGPSLSAALEAVLLVVDEPVPEVVLAQVVERPTQEVVGALEALAADYASAGRGFVLRRMAAGWRFYTNPDCAAYVERFVLDGQQARLTSAALEVLAVVAYRQPVSRGRIAAVRGVNSDAVVRTLLARGLIEEAGTDPDGSALLYRTTPYFLERLGVAGVTELPPLAPLVPDPESLVDE